MVVTKVVHTNARLATIFGPLAKTAFQEWLAQRVGVVV